MTIERQWSGLEIAIVGMAGRFPGAPDIDALWRNLVDGVESISRIDLQTLVAHGRDESEVRAAEFVPAHGVLDGHDLFDAEFFGYRPREAEGIDPQQRLFLEVAWEALEHAGYDPARHAGLTGVFAGSGANQYLYEQLHRNPAALARIGVFQANYSNQADHLAPRVSYKLNLSGPSVAVQSACSTSLVAVHLACQQLLTGACDMALAGGVSLTLPRFWGYRYEEGMILSPDGHCRAFDADAQGCLKGDGLGVVVLKRLADALADGDHIEALILGSACNNDGASKVGYTAPGLDGQAQLISSAHAVAGIEPDSIGYIEAHGTGTPLGDPIEIRALTQAFRRATQRTGFCGIGSVKTNLGHLDAAAGVTGLIKAALALKHATLPASLHFRAANPAFDLPSTPFRVIDRTQPWPTGETPRRAAVSSFGIGGTNAHAVLEEAPPPTVESSPDDGPQLLLLSARTPEALEAAARRLADHLEAHPQLSLRDVAHTLALGRHAFALRRAVVAHDTTEAVAALRKQAAGTRASDSAPSVVFMFPGQGAQYVGMGRGLYQQSAVFRSHVDASCDALLPLLGQDLRDLLFRSPADDPAAVARLQQTAITQPALFVIEYALAQTLLSLGIEPAAMVGHSLGEYVAACLSGVFSLDDALKLVVQRGRLMQAQAPGSMLAVSLPAAALRPLLGPGLSLAAENASGLSVAAGPSDLVDALAAQLATGQAVQTTRLHTSHAFHSAMMEPAVGPFLDVIAGIPRQAPKRRFVSSVTGNWADAGALADPQHWARSVRDSVHFASALDTLFTLAAPLLLEVGPGTTLGGLARQHDGKPPGLVTAATLRHPSDGVDDSVFFLGMLGRLWCAGVDIGSHWLGDGARRRVALPTYAFQRQRYWVDPAPEPRLADSTSAGPLFYLPTWQRAAAQPATALRGRWVVVGAAGAIQPFESRLRAAGCDVTAVHANTATEWGAAWTEAIAAATPDHLLMLAPAGMSHASCAGLPALLRTLAAQAPAQPPRITLATEGTAAVLGDEALQPDQALAAGWLQVLPQELAAARTRVVDLEAFDSDAVTAVLGEAQADDAAAWVAIRRGRRWVRRVAPVLPGMAPPLPKRLRQRGVYVISGGLGGMGLVLAEYLARAVQARLVLFGRSAFPGREQWAAWLREHPNDDPTSRTIARLQAIEALGAEVLVDRADVADSAALRALQIRAGARFGAVNGVIHAAGLPGGGLIALQDDARVAAVLAPKLAGARAMLDVFGAREVDFVVLCSSLTSFVPLIGRSEYTAANLWLDTLAQSRAGTAPFTLSINWDNWRETGMANAAAGTDFVGLSNGEGVAALAWALDQDEPQLLVAKRDLLAHAQAPGATAGEVTQPSLAATAESALATVAPPSGVPRAAAPTGAPTSALDAGASAASESAALTPIERQLLVFARDLLGVEQLGLHDDFFEHGGDSVVGIQLVARARRAGLVLSAKQVFELKTVAALAAAAAAAAAATPVTNTPPATDGAQLTHASPTPAHTTSLSLTPIQHWFFGLPLAQRGHWNLGLTLQTPVDADPAILSECLDAAVARHDVFRSRFVQRQGTWTVVPGAGERVAFEHFDLSTIADPDALALEFARLDARAQAAFDLEHGPLLRAVHAHAGNRPGRLFIGVHHLAADLLGLQVLAEDLNDCWDQRARGAVTPVIPPVGTAWSHWTERLHAFAQGPAADASRAHWNRLGGLPQTRLPRDRPDAPNRHAGTRLWHSSFDETATRALLAQAAASDGMPAVLLAALAQALCTWSGQSLAWIDVEGHGREPIADDVDVSRCVGWFTTLYPLALPATADAHQAARALREVPLGGTSFGLLRYLHRDPAVRAEMAQLARPELVFLYQGQRRDDRRAAAAALPLLGIGAEHGHAGDDPRSHLFEVNAWVAAGCLHVDWAYSPDVHDEASVLRLAQAFERALEPRPHTAGAVRHIEAATTTAPLSFAQERIWFLQRLDEGATVYNKQAVVELDGMLDATALRDALDAVVARHETLRTRFVLRDGSPVQLIDAPARRELPLIDIEGGDAQAARAVARSRAAVAFDLAAAPAFDAALLRLGEQQHWLVLTLHHIVTDAWSLQVLVGELAALYSARRRGTPDPLPPLATTLAAYAQWQRQWLHGPTLDSLLGYWTKQLAGLAPLNLPTDRPRPPVQRSDGARFEFRWPAPLTAALRQLGRSAGASPFMCLLALYKLLLQRYSGQNDIVVGAPAADRPRVETEGLIGPLVNNLVLRTDLSGEPDFLTLLARVRETVLSANEHRDLPFEKLVEALNPPRDRSRSPLFEVMFAYMNVPGATGEWDGLRAHARELEAGGAEFDLSLYAYAPGNAADARLHGWFEYSTALFDAATIERMAGHLQQLAQAACAEPTRSSATLQLMTDAELRQVVVDWNDTRVDHPPVAALHLLFEQQVQRCPASVAAVFDDATLSYADLDQRANRLARYLRSLGVAPDDRVALCVERNSAMLIGLLGILKSGAAYVPLDPAYPADRIAHMLDDCGARVVLTQERWLERVAPQAATLVCLDRDAAQFDSLDPSPLPTVTEPGHLAYVIYTSGSTGRPKGVQIEHGAAVNFVQAMLARPGLNAGDCLLAVTTISFDIHVLELFVPLAAGARIIVATRAAAADASQLRRILQTERVSAMQATPATWRMLVDAGWPGTPGLKLLCGGEALSPDLARALLPRCAELWNLYGPTEATVWATLDPITDGDAPISVGRPFDNMRAYVLGPRDQPLPIGVPGELCLGGRGVARGYLDRPELTAERFGADPFVAGQQIYRTGDLARWRADGRIDVLGRLDNQVKLRGHRVELGEIEAVVGAHDALAQCVCLVREDRPGDQRLVAYAIARSPLRPELAQLRQFASRELPDYMLPSALVWLDEFPLTPNGKVDRRALPAPAQGPAGGRNDTPLTPPEQFFADIFAEVLATESVARYDNFFDLGGHSLLVMKVVDRVEQRSGIRMHPGELFQQTVGQLAALYAARLPVAAAPVRADLEHIEPVFFAGTAGSLYGCHHLPGPASSGRAVLICAPIGHEYARCHRALRQLAAQLARRGFHALRFDYHGSGDSEGESDMLSLAQCRRDIGSAITELKRRSAAPQVALVGMRLGATLAFQAAADRNDVSDVVLWHPVNDGAAMLAQWRADQREFATALGYRSDEAVEQVLGVPLPPALSREIDTVAIDASAGSAARMLVADGTDPRQPMHAFLAQRQATRGHVDLLTLADSPVWRQEPLEALVPSDALRAIVDWLEPKAGSAHGQREAFIPARIAERGPVSGESVLRFGPQRSQVGILNSPGDVAAGNADLAVIFINAGLIHHVGPNRLHVRLARALAAAGIASLRIDLSGIGDSPPRADHLSIYDLVRREPLEAMDGLAEHGLRRFVLVGICSGAYSAFHVACHDARVVAAVMINPEDLSLDGSNAGAEQSVAWARRYWTNSLFRPRAWLNLLSGRVNYRRLLSTLSSQFKSSAAAQGTPPRSALQSDMLQAMLSRRLALLFLSSGDDVSREYVSLLLEDGNLSQAPVGALHREVLEECDHLFTRIEDQRRLVELLVSWTTKLSTDLPAPSSGVA